MPTLRAKYQRWSGTIALIAVAVASSYGLHLVDREARERSAVDRTRTAQLEWDKEADDHAACARQATSRIEVRRTFDDVFDSIARFAAPDRLSEVRRVIDAEKRTVSKALPPLDCSVLAPPPKGPRPRIP